MVIGFENLFGRQYEGGANWLEVSLYSLGLTPDPPHCLVLGADETLPATLRDGQRVSAVPLPPAATSTVGRIVDAAARRITRRPWEDQRLTDIAAKFNVDLWVGFSGFEGLSPRRPLLVWHPDFQSRHLPELFSDDEIRDRERQWDFVAGRAEGIVVISQAVAQDALSTHPQVASRLHVLGFPPLFTDANVSMQPEAARRKYHLPERFFLVCNQFWTHKNHQLVLQALSELKRGGGTPPVVAFTGRLHDYRNPGWVGELLNFVNKEGLNEYCRFLGVVSRAEQLALIRAASAVIHPSLFEGRGAIVEEAHVLGAQVLCSDLPVHRELDAPGTVFFPPHDVEALADLMRNAGAPSSLTSAAIVEESQRRLRRYGEDFLRMCRAITGVEQGEPAESADRSALHVKLNES